MKKLSCLLLLLLLVLPVLLSGSDSALITLRAHVLAAVGESGSTQVISGKDGFLFFGESAEAALKPLTEEELTGLTAALSRLAERLAAEDRSLLVLIAPDKRTVYPEKLPGRLRGLPDEWTSVDRALREAGIRTVPALPALLEAKDEGLVYFAGDTHWNARGALAVIKEIGTALQAELLPEPSEPAFQPGTAGDLIRLCRPSDPLTEPDAEPVLSRRYRALRPFGNTDAMKIETVSETTDLRLLVIRDSFGKALFPYLANAVGALTFSRLYTEIPAQAEAAAADTVLLEIVERDLRTLTETPLM